jgi:hypothetical protein
MLASGTLTQPRLHQAIGHERCALHDAYPPDNAACWQFVQPGHRVWDCLRRVRHPHPPCLRRCHAHRALAVRGKRTWPTDAERSRFERHCIDDRPTDLLGDGCPGGDVLRGRPNGASYAALRRQTVLPAAGGSVPARSGLAHWSKTTTLHRAIRDEDEIGEACFGLGLASWWQGDVTVAGARPPLGAWPPPHALFPRLGRFRSSLTGWPSGTGRDDGRR